MTTKQPDLAAAVDLARLAPSVHNTQPWRFRVDGDALTLRCDHGRRLEALDPSGRQQVLSCGAALYLAQLALREQGFISEVETFPQPLHADVLARLVPVSRHEVLAEDVVLAGAARRRHTQRGAFEERAVPRELLAELRVVTAEFGTWIRVVDDPDDLVALTVLLARADDDEREDEAYQAELADWTARPEGALDGLPAAATPDVHGRASNLRLRDFHGGEEATSWTARYPAGDPPAVERPLALVLGTEQDTATDWLRAGEALMALLLHATVEGVQAQPLGQVVDREWSRARLGAALGVLGHPQIVLRVGYANPGPESPRRPLDQIVDS